MFDVRPAIVAIRSDPFGFGRFCIVINRGIIASYACPRAFMIDDSQILD